MNWWVRDPDLRALQHVFSALARCPQCMGVCMAVSNGVEHEGIVEAYEGWCPRCGDFVSDHHGIHWIPPSEYEGREPQVDVE